MPTGLEQGHGACYPCKILCVCVVRMQRRILKIHNQILGTDDSKHGTGRGASPHPRKGRGKDMSSFEIGKEGVLQYIASDGVLGS